MDPSYNNSFGSFSSSGGVPNGGVVSNGAAGGDIILSSGGEKKSKKWLVVVLILLVVGIGGGVGGFVLLQSGGLSGGQVSEDDYENVISLLATEESKMAEIVYKLKIWKDEEHSVADFINGSTIGLIDRLMDSLSSIEKTELELSEIAFPGDTKKEIEKARLDMDGYRQITYEVLEELRAVCRAFLDANYDELEEFAIKNGFSETIKDEILEQAREYSTMKPLLEDRENNREDCKRYLMGTASETSVPRAIFTAVISTEEITKMEDYKNHLAETRGTIMEQKWSRYGGADEEQE